MPETQESINRRLAYKRKEDRMALEGKIIKGLMILFIILVLISCFFVGQAINDEICHRQTMLMHRDGFYDMWTATCYVESSPGKYVPLNQFRGVDTNL